MGHWSDRSLVRRVTGLIGHWSKRNGAKFLSERRYASAGISRHRELAKKVQLALIGSRPRTFQRSIDEPCMLPLSLPKRWHKTPFCCYCQ